MAYKVSKRIEPERWNAILEANKPDLQRFFSNVDHLSRLRYGSRNRAVIALRAKTGWITTSHTVREFINGVFLIADINLLRSWSLLFGESLPDMLSRDYAKEDELKGLALK